MIRTNQSTGLDYYSALGAGPREAREPGRDWPAEVLAGRGDRPGPPRPGAIRKYLNANPGSVPEPVGTLEGPTGRQIPAFRRRDLQDFDRKRTGDNTGAAGRPTGPQHRDRKPETQRINTALGYLREIGGYRRGVAAELAARHHEPAWKWERAVKEARNQRSSTDAAEHKE
ncbi:hypothetical protein [Actinacidiphila soli]|uniref:hypothetical protein n=1 Tax=Actinacidiphila soli TaxID=2487275 RepID=UPI000FCAA34A|nr:hypothetical protein [Actinacidiphila soli]